MRRDYAFTSYLMLVRSRPEGIAQPLPPSAVVVVESANCGVEYAAPKDIQWASLWEGESPFAPGRLHSLHPFVVRALCVDGTVIEIPKSIDAGDLKSLLDGQYRPDGLWPVVAIVVIVCVVLCSLSLVVAGRAREPRSPMCDES